MSNSTFQSYHNVYSSSYNQIVSNYKDLPRNSSNFQTGPNGTRGFYASNSYANRTGYNEQYHSSNNGFDGTVNESWEVVSKWVSLGDASGGIPEWVSKTLGGVGILTKGRELGEWEYLRQAKFNRQLTGDFSKPVKHSLRLFKNVGRGVTGLSVAASGYQFLESDRSGNDYARLSGSLIITGTAFIPIVGPIISIGLGVADSYGAFDGIYNYFD